MTNTRQIGFIALMVMMLLTAFLIIANVQTPIANGSVSRSGEYQATTTLSVAGSAMRNLQNITATTTTTAGTLGSVVITGAAAGTMNFYDATTSSVLLRATSMSTTSITITEIPASAVAGVYTFDTLFSNGLLVEIVGTAPTSTITWRQN